MSDLIAYYRAGGPCQGDVCRHRESGCPCTETADEIERLEAENKQLHADYWTQNKCIADLQDERRGLQAKVEQLEGALFGSNGALTRMDRARKILNDRHGFDNWNVLNTDDIKAALKGGDEHDPFDDLIESGGLPEAQAIKGDT